MNPYMKKAHYLEQVIPEYRGNPLIEALPEIWASDAVVEMLSEESPYHDGERMLRGRKKVNLDVSLGEEISIIQAQINSHMEEVKELKQSKKEIL